MIYWHSKRRDKPLRITKKNILLTLFITGFLSVFHSFYLHAQEDEVDWWFDVEILLFSYEDAPQTVQETFADEVSVPGPRQAFTLFDDWFLPSLDLLVQHLPVCDMQRAVSTPLTGDDPLTADELMCRETQHESVAADSHSASLKSVFNISQFAPTPELTWEHIDRIPVIIDGYPSDYPSTAHFLPSQTRELMELYKNIRWDKSTQVLLHTVWRQPVPVGEANAISVPLKAGRNLTYDAQHDGSQGSSSDTIAVISETTTSSLATQISANLALLAQGLGAEAIIYPEQIAIEQESIDLSAQFELEGNFNVFIKYIRGVPYLHVDAHMAFYREIAKLDNGVEYQLIVPHEFKQRRRVISQQVHYFDHPYFGMIVELRRFKRQLPETTEIVSEFR